MKRARSKALRAEIVEAHVDWSGETTPRRMKLRTLKKWETRSLDRSRRLARYFRNFCRPWELPW